MQRPPTPRHDRRRSQVRAALHGLVCAKGYAAVSLRALAEAAGMSPSHLLYYYPSKDAVLEDLFERAAQKMLRDLRALPSGSPAAQCRALADYFFGESAMTRAERGFMLEMFGLATHNERLRRTKAQFDAAVKGYLTGLLRRTPGGAAPSPEDAAEIALAALAGLLTSSFFDDDLELARAEALFRGVLARLTGLPDVAPRARATA